MGTPIKNITINLDENPAEIEIKLNKKAKALGLTKVEELHSPKSGALYKGYVD